MQLGTRWKTGDPPPRSVPETLHSAIAQVEASGNSGYWTLTWLEGRPIAELDSGWEVLLSAEGTVLAQPFDD